MAKEKAQFIEYVKREDPRKCKYVWRSKLNGREISLGYPMLGHILKRLRNQADPANVAAVWCEDIAVINRIKADLDEGILDELPSPQ